MPIFSNVGEVGEWLTDVVGSIDFGIPGKDRTLGEDVAEAVADGIIDRSLQDQQGATVRWPENSEPYRSRKRRNYGTDKTNFRTEQMISKPSLLANVRGQAKQVTMQYGLGEAPTSSKTGHLEMCDRLITDTEKASFAHEQGRPFYEVDEDIDTQNVLPIVGDAIARFLQEKANG